MLERYGHGGDLRTAEEAYGRPAGEFLDFSSNMNPFGPPSIVRRLLSTYADEIVRYPDPAVRELKAKLASHFGIPTESILVGNGAAELIDLLIRVRKPTATAIARPSFSEYTEAVHKTGGTMIDIPLRESFDFVLDEADVQKALERADTVFLGHPNNPTGRLIPPGILSILRKSHKTIILDEAFIDFTADEASNSLLREAAHDPELYVIRSMTKCYAIPGIRLGFMVAHPDRIAALQAQQVTWSVNSLAQQIGVAVLDDEQYVARTRTWLANESPRLRVQLQAIGLKVYPSDVNFFLLRLPDGICVQDVQAAMGRRGVLVRDGSRFAGLDNQYCRVAIRTEQENESLVRALRDTLDELRNNSSLLSQTVKARTLMLQGTASDVGKSLLTAALCRIFTQDGWLVAPFKSQNMSLNSYVTADGKEIGRAQGMQADACRILATTDINPILLKPTQDMAAQVVVHGKPLADMDARSYREHYLPIAGGIVRDALERLTAQYELVVLEGAGSPAEVNLKDRDIVNMRLAGWAEAPVLLVADIDRGGVFASIVGTLDILTQEERDRIQGFIINKFRGDITLLQPGIDWLEERTGKPVLGVIPYLPKVGLEDEDSASLHGKLQSANRSFAGTTSDSKPNKIANSDQIDIVVIKLPFLSNFTDFDPLLDEPDTVVRYVEGSEYFGQPDVVILPGSKSTMADLQFLRESGLAHLIDQHVRLGGFVTGICAGFQMMGRLLLDPLGVESTQVVMAGLGYFATETEFASVKRTERIIGIAAQACWPDATDLPIKGYEIHMGRTRFLEPTLHPFLIRQERDEALVNLTEWNDPEGAMSENGRVWGTYVHGILHNDALRRAWLNRVRTAKGLAPITEIVHFGEKREVAFDRLAAHVRKHLDLTRIYEMISLKPRRTEESNG